MKVKEFTPNLIQIGILISLLLITFNCTTEGEKMNKITSVPFGKMADGRTAELFTLTNSNGMQISVTNYGGIITRIIVPDKNGKMGDVVLGYDSLADYIKETPYFGAIIGRYGNRIKNGKFSLNGVVYSLATNNGPNHLHGGVKGFDKVLWIATKLQTPERFGLELKYTSPDGEEGYPGTLLVKVTYLLTDQNEIRIEYEATSNKPTICNLTNHSYFNLKDAGESSILKHKLMIDGDYITPVDATLIPTGKLMPVAGNPFDFREPATISGRINDKHEQLNMEPGGYDHNFVLNGKMGELRKVAELTEPESGRILEVYTKEPGMQVYSGNFLDGTITGKDGIVYELRSGLCLETQHFPDSPNQPDFASTVLNPGEVYSTTTIYKFSKVSK